MLNKTLNISTSPHITKGNSTDVIMKNVVYALLPAAGFAVYAFGLSAFFVLLTSVVSCVLTEHILCKVSHKETTINDWSAIITGLLLGLTLPPIFPLWMTFCGGVIAIGLGKFLFGGLGYNVFNPALVGRAVLQAAFPVAITTWYEAFQGNRFTEIASSVLALPFMQPIFDGTSGATPLSAFKFDHVTAPTTELMFGLTGGSTGETCGVIIILGGIYLISRKMANWRIPTAIIGTVILLSSLLYFIDPLRYPNPLFMVFSGGLLLGAFFMATDMVGSPLTSIGVWIYGVFIGILVVVVRVWGGLPEGVMYAILLGNAIAPQIDNFVKPRVYGTSKQKKS
ncbi:RnfABCDGE type electron transport complex subunit D [Flammeovirga kamogawensis]|uniref:Ion-translocating oxidoreductase complex subunit D n=1 Tax=Flammeovirga kamogawensis TaxID=373891 RepID=A0ABX8H186_9BACT|nr:RnfABCDGE type electron transport complex subunit D [Flammeovirga kamogawensis]MBB6462601.1 electron transport complex protein RnfD [Flammeovirga kamogawensis]QWG09654.1 RnfABCDGE type electron transport complex subunit D [Flammeovirga kamogawensis]TRX65168.1 RnfABCDGE type electron transport complex subunit D [Flammeovirga kamogawensis]